MVGRIKKMLSLNSDPDLKEKKMLKIVTTKCYRHTYIKCYLIKDTPKLRLR